MHAVKVNCGLNVIEISALLLLTYISSSENYGRWKLILIFDVPPTIQLLFGLGVHETMFISFMVFSIAHMIVTNYLFWHLCVVYPDDVDLATSLRWKMRLSSANIIIFAFSVYCFFRHNRLCEPGSKYAVITN